MLRGQLEQSLSAIWYGGAAVPLWLSALEPIYARLSAVHRRWPRRVERLPVPLLVVGNLTVGGSGKTPLVAALVERARIVGFAAAVVSRGYRSRARAARRVALGDSADEVGDEPLLLARSTGAPVYVGARRIEAARLAAADGATLLIADDGLQHRHWRADAQVLVVDGQRRFGNGRLLPAGPLREPIGDLRRFDLLLQKGGSATPRFDLLATGLRRLDGGLGHELAWLQGRRVQAFAGIAHPQAFAQTLRALGAEVQMQAYADHQRYCAADLDLLDPSLPWITTAKDAVKLAELAPAQTLVLEVRAVLDPPAIEAVDALLQRLGGST